MTGVASGETGEAEVTPPDPSLVSSLLAWVSAGVVLAELSVGLLAERFVVALVLAVLASAVGLLAWWRSSRRRKRLGLLAGLLPAQVFAIAYPLTIVAGPWGTHVRDFGISPYWAFLGIVLMLAAAACGWLLIVFPGVHALAADRDHSRSTVAKIAVVAGSFAAAAALVVQGAGLLAVPELVAIAVVRRQLEQRLGNRAPRTRRSVPRRVATYVAVGLVAYVGLGVALFISDPLGLGSGPFEILFHGAYDAQSNLQYIAPDDGFPHGFVGYRTQTAEEMARRFPGRHLRFVAADQPSTGPLVISVNPIDDYDWGAVALGKNGRCYAIVWAADRSNPRYGGERTGEIPRGQPCLGSAATPDRITASAW